MHVLFYDVSQTSDSFPFFKIVILVVFQLELLYFEILINQWYKIRVRTMKTIVCMVLGCVLHVSMLALICTWTMHHLLILNHV